MPLLKNNWASGELFGASDANAVASAINSILTGGSDTGRRRVVETISTAKTMGALAFTDYVAFLGAGAVVTMPSAVVSNTNRYTLKNISSASITVLTTGSNSIDDDSTLVLVPGASADLIVGSDGDWRVI